MLVRSFSNGFQVQDWTQELNVIPNQWGTIGEFGIFQPESVAASSVVLKKSLKTVM